MLRLIALLLLLAGPALADSAPPPGRIWNRSGLPATLPLLVRSDAGPNWLLALAGDDGRPVLTAIIGAGQPFRVLVPPGDWHLSFTQGEGWRRDETRFDRETARLDLEQPLHFGVEGVGRKSGYLIDLRGLAPGTAHGGTPGLAARGLCQRLLLVPGSLRPAEGELFAKPRYEIRTRLCD